jgi:hypothetical protein
MGSGVLWRNKQNLMDVNMHIKSYINDSHKLSTILLGFNPILRHVFTPPLHRNSDHKHW